MLFPMNVAPTLAEHILNLKALTFQLVYTLFAQEIGDNPSSLIPIRSSVRLKDAVHLSTPCLHVVKAVWTQQVVSPVL